MRYLVNTLPHKLLIPTLPVFYRINGDYKNYHNPIIISSGGNTLYASIVLKSLTGGLNLYSGSPKQFNPSMIDLIYTVVPIPNLANNVVLDLPPVNIEKIMPRSSANIYTLLIGGNGAGYQYSKKDWAILVTAIKEIAFSHNIKWLITTSRRSGVFIEELLDQLNEPSVIEELTLYGRKPEKVMSRYLQEAEVIFCTEDSLTMVSEAIYSGKKVYTLHPKVYQPDQNDANALEKYDSSGFIERHPIESIGDVSVNKKKLIQVLPNINKQIYAPVLKKLRSIPSK